jgi:hypothetical protein
MQKIYIFIVAAALFISCDKGIVLDLNESESKIVIEGLVTDQPGEQFIKITKTAGFYSQGKTPRVIDATVSVKDNLGNIFVFVHNPNDHADSAGYYLPQDPFVGEVGRTYIMTVTVDGKTFTAEDEMFSVTPITKLEYRVNEDEEEDPEEKGKIYEVLFFAIEPQETKDYYLFKFYRNDSIKFANDNDVYWSDDVLLGENIEGLPSPNFYGIGDKAKIELYSLSRNGFIFYSDLQKLLLNDGGLFSSPPANCRTNLTNGALGFFQVSSLKSSEIMVE